MSKQSGFKVQTTDMGAKEVTFVVEAGDLLLEKVLSGHKPKKKHQNTDELETEFVQSLKLVLDQRFGPQWTVIGGLDFGFALKNRKNSAIVMNGNLFGKNFQVVAYRSPGHEIFSNAVVAAIADRKLRNESSVPGNSSKEISDLILAEDNNLNLASNETADHQVRARKFREVVTAATEISVWHAVVGSHFRVAFPEEVSDQHAVLLSSSGGRTVRALVFRHQQQSSKNLLSYLPVVSKVLMIVFCLVLMLQTRLGFSESWVQMLGVAVLALALMKLLHAYVSKKKENTKKLN